MNPPNAYSPSIGSQFASLSISEHAPVTTKRSSPLSLATQSEPFSFGLNSRLHLDDSLRSLFAIIKASNLTPNEKNRRFVEQLAKTQFIAHLRLSLHTQLVQQLTFRLCSPNNLMPRDIEEVENASVPFCVLNHLAGASQQAPDFLEVPHLDFRSIVLPHALRTQINANEVYKKKAGVENIQTLQEWSHGFTHSLDLPLADPMPQVTGDFYRIAAFVPIKRERQQNITEWNPFVRGETGPKMLFSYSASQGEGSFTRATPGMSRRNNYIPMQDMPENNPNWTHDILAFDKTKQAEVITKIKRATVNFAVLPVHPIEPYPRTIASPPRTARNSPVVQLPVTYGTYNATGRHRVESESAVLLQISPVPIDVTGIETQEALINYLQGLASITRELERVEDLSLSQQAAAPLSIRHIPRTRENRTPVKDLIQNISERIDHFTTWCRDLFNSFMTTIRS